MSQDIALPDYLKEFVDDAEIAKSTDMVSSASSVPRISLKGKKFRLKKGEEEVAKYSDEMMCIIVGIQPDRGLAKTYYKDKYDPDNSAPPDCSSTNGATPDTWISNPQCDNCADCPQNKWGSGVAMTKGKQAKACRESKILWIVDPREKPAEGEERTLYGLNVTVSSLKALTAYAKELATHGVPTPAAVITKLLMDDDSEYPQLTFHMAQFLKEAQGRYFIERSKKREWESDEHRMLAAPAGGSAKQVTHQQDDPPAQAKDAPIEGELADTQVDDEGIDDILENW